mgnify:CR=1 FL=1
MNKKKGTKSFDIPFRSNGLVILWICDVTDLFLIYFTMELDNKMNYFFLIVLDLLAKGATTFELQ